MQNNNINVQVLKLSQENFFKMWVLLIQPFLKLNKGEANILSKLLYHRYLISKEVKNKEIIDDLLFSVKIKKKIIAELGKSEVDYNNRIVALRKKKAIIGRTINKQIIPIIKEPFDNFKLVYDINIIDAK